MEVIFGILMMVVFGWWFYNFVIWPQQDQMRKETAKKLESCITFDYEANTLKLHQFHPDICKVVKMEPYEIPHTSYKPDSVTYTSVTVAGSPPAVSPITKATSIFPVTARQGNTSCPIWERPSSISNCVPPR